MMQGTNVLFSVLVLGAFFCVSDACFCAPMNVNKTICDADFVVTVRVSGLTTVPADHAGPRENFLYTVDVLRYCKNKGTVLKTVVSESPAMCGVLLKVGQSYLISGEVTGDTRISIDKCNSVIKQLGVTPDHEIQSLYWVAEYC